MANNHVFVWLQDEGWKPSITVKQILLGIQVGGQGSTACWCALQQCGVHNSLAGRLYLDLFVLLAAAV
jgi:hypothetical protein